MELRSGTIPFVLVYWTKTLFGTVREAFDPH